MHFRVIVWVMALSAFIVAGDLEVVKEALKKKDVEKAANVAFDACLEKNDLEVCDYFGTLLFSWGDTGYTKAKLFFEKGCELNKNPHGCRMLAHMYYTGKGVNKDHKQAFKYSKKACDNGNGLSCKDVGSFYLKGDGVKQDNALAIKFFEKACHSKEAISCSHLGLVYFTGEYSIQKDVKKGLELWEKGCNGGDAISCSTLGILYEENYNNKQALAYFQKGCELKDESSCKRYEKLKNN